MLMLSLVSDKYKQTMSLSLLPVYRTLVALYQHLTRMCTLWRCKSMVTGKAKLLWMTSHY